MQLAAEVGSSLAGLSPSRVGCPLTPGSWYQNRNWSVEPLVTVRELENWCWNNVFGVKKEKNKSTTVSIVYKDVPSICHRSVAQSCLTLCDPMDCSTPGLPVRHQLPEFAQTHVH